MNPAARSSRSSSARKHDIKTLLSLSTTYKRLDSEGAGVNLLLVDACRDDAGQGGRSGFNQDNAPRPPRGVAALFSCSDGQKAWESPKLGNGHGVFFYHVLEGLRGKARDSNSKITWDDLQKYVREQVPDDVPRLAGGGARQEATSRVSRSSPHKTPCRARAGS